MINPSLGDLDLSSEELKKLLIYLKKKKALTAIKACLNMNY